MSKKVRVEDLGSIAVWGSNLTLGIQSSKNILAE